MPVKVAKLDSLWLTANADGVNRQHAPNALSKLTYVQRAYLVFTWKTKNANHAESDARHAAPTVNAHHATQDLHCCKMVTASNVSTAVQNAVSMRCTNAGEDVYRELIEIKRGAFHVHRFVQNANHSTSVLIAFLGMNWLMGRAENGVRIGTVMTVRGTVTCVRSVMLGIW